MNIYDKLYINGQWVSPLSGEHHEINNPATGQPCARTPFAGEDDVVLAIKSARAAFASWSQTSARERCDFINAAADEMERRIDDFTSVVSQTMGCPAHIARDLQIAGSIDAFRSFAQRAAMMEATEEKDGFLIVKEPVGVCTLINPWNYPLSQLVGKLGPALAAGCTVVVKPAEQTPLQDFLIAEVLDKIGLPAGVFNLISGSGSKLGKVLCGHPDVDMVSFTGSTSAGVKISEAAASTIKRVCLELGGKSPYIITEDADLDAAVRYGVEDVMLNTGQTCNALTRMLVPRSRYDQALEIAKAVAEENIVGDPLSTESTMGPMSSEAQKRTVLGYIEKGIAEGARLLTGGVEMPEGLSSGAYVKPTIFADVNNDMTIAREEIFGPVLCIIPYGDLDEAVEIANDTVFGLSSAVYAQDKNTALRIARRMRSGQCFVQGGYFNMDAPFGGYKQSGNGREWGKEGLAEYVETKAVIGD